MEQSDNQEVKYVSFPDTYSRRRLNALYREIPLKDTVFRTLRKYFNAMATLYGVISLKKAYEIIAEQSPSLVTEEEFLAFAEIARREIESYCILGEEEIFLDGKAGSPWEREIIDELLLYGSSEDTDPYLKTKASQEGKPYYVPEKKQFLLYADASYCEPTPEATALRAYISKNFRLDEEEQEDLFQEILYIAHSLNAPFSDVTDLMEDMGIQFKNTDDLQEFMTLEQNFHNTTRMQCNRGHTPKEIFDLLPPEHRMQMSVSIGPNIRASLANGKLSFQGLRDSILTMDLPNEGIRFNFLKELADIEKDCKAEEKTKGNTPAPKKKVGRNDPCPCGSGKKYKKCCGR